MSDVTFRIGHFAGRVCQVCGRQAYIHVGSTVDVTLDRYFCDDHLVEASAVRDRLRQAAPGTDGMQRVG